MQEAKTNTSCRKKIRQRSKCELQCVCWCQRAVLDAPYTVVLLVISVMGIG